MATEGAPVNQPGPAFAQADACGRGLGSDSNEFWRWCPRCAHELVNERCKLRCPRCQYFMSCSDFDMLR